MWMVRPTTLLGTNFVMASDFPTIELTMKTAKGTLWAMVAEEFVGISALI